MTWKTLLLGATASLAFAQVAQAERGSDGEVRVIYYQAPSILNPYLSAGTKDEEASSLILEPLIRFNPAGEMVPWLVTEIPTLENGGVAEDMKSITYKLKPDLKWSDGTPVTAEDVVFTYEYCTAPGGGCAQASIYEGIDKVEAVDASTVRILFTEPKPVPYVAFAGAQGPILQKKQFADCLGEKAPTCTQQNFNPIGTGPFKVDEFRPNDVITLSANPNYRDPAKPAFAKMTLKGGGDAASAARSVLETGEFDYAWNTQLAPEVLDEMLKGGKGRMVFAFGSLVERLEINLTDASPSLPADERGTVKHPHPILTDIKVRQALSMAIDRALLAEVGYGDAGKPTCNLVPAPAAYADDTNTGCLTQDIEGAKALLEEAGWTVGAGGVREKDGKKLSLLFQTSTNAVRQDFQSIIKEWWNEIGVQTELKNVDGSVFFGSDPGSPDTFPKFWADVEMYANNFNGADPEAYLAERICSKIPSPQTQWQGQNVGRFCVPEYDDLAVQLGQTGDLEKRGEIARKMNDMLTRDSMTILPLVYRGTLSAASNTLGGVDINAWDSQLWNVADWYREK
ncbi:peptide ABC transporter substrate-binding protein [Sinirhodobacter populi]|uniref:Peptide ABC transporter substrate-binding protein n=1 Tax=Paenirhodobacter populi TaxID=2306993 RepID=A0A443K8J8_9RHOB|nr:peptide ABC transporter substrate-binding protein [Sinirhodobacter populi]RWR29119.1 peptide ABC transporter substrate-binding protein [Sinirhodobacter populi]RWR34537.1 peptide ABC transporter substrate-binding protein [Sinirhodobacter populi]